MQISELVKQAHDNAVAKGFWDKPREFGTLIALIHSELSEALEADRRLDGAGVAEELADVVIRVADLCSGYGLYLEDAIINKMAINKQRPHKHGKAY